jgi:hypothetical protein
VTVDALLALAGFRGGKVLDEHRFAAGRRLLTGTGFVLGERLLGRVFQAGDRQPAVVALGVATAVATVDLLVGTQEESVPRAIKVTLEERQIGPSDTDQPAANKLVGDFVERLGETNNLLVEFGEVNSRLAPEGDEERLAGSLGLGLRGGIIGVPAVRLRIRPLGEGGKCNEEGDEDGRTHWRVSVIGQD